MFLCTDNKQKSDSYNQRLRTGAKKRKKNDRFPDPVEKLGYLSIPILSTTVINSWPYKSYKTIANKVNVVSGFLLQLLFLSSYGV